MGFIFKRHLLTLLIPLLLCSCGNSTQATQGITQPVPGGGPSLVLAPEPVTQDFTVWLANFKNEAVAKGIAPAVVEAAFSDIAAPLEGVVERDHTQPEHTKSFDEYLQGVLKPKRIDAGREQWQTHEALLAEVQRAYGVPAPVLLSLWQIESNYGKIQGNYNIIHSLATLAYDGRRAEFFRKELLNALTILQQENMPAHELTGSWAGAMGQVQFMPTSFLAFAVDFDGDGRRDIWTSDADALASMANYLHTKGWDPAIGWGVHVRLPRGGDSEGWATSKEKHSLKEWQRLGFKRYDGGKLPANGYKTRLVIPDNDPSYAYLVYPNYDVIMDWNHSTYFATSVNLLADAIAEQ